MKRLLVAAWLGALLAGIALAQTKPQDSSSAPAQGSGTIAPAGSTTAGTVPAAQPTANLATTPLQAGNIVYAELAKSVDAKKAKVGDEIQARATQAALSQGKIVIPRGAKIIGHITQVTQRAGDQPSQLGFSFDHAVLKDGTQVPLSVSVQALGGGASAGSVLDQSPNMGGGNRGSASVGMGGRPAASEAGGYGAPGGNMGGMSSAGAGAASSAGGMSTGDTGPAVVHLNAGSKGVVGLSGLSMTSSDAHGTVITSDKKNVKLDSGIELVLRSN